MNLKQQADTAHALLLEHKYSDAIRAADALIQNSETPEKLRNAWLDAVKDAGMVEHLYADLPDLTHLRWHGACDWHNAISSQITDSTDNLSIVFFHVDAAGTHPYAKDNKAIDYVGTLYAAGKVARAAHAQSNIIVISDEVSAFPDKPEWLHVVRVPATAAEMMYSRMRANRALAVTGKLRGPVAFLDTDVCLNKDISPIFDGTFDVALTYRTDFLFMPINEAMILATQCHGPSTIKHFDLTLALYEWIAAQDITRTRYGFDVKKWRGGQLALASLVGWKFPASGRSEVNISGVRYSLLPCDEYNRPIKSGDEIPSLLACWAVHFKGNAAKSVLFDYIKIAHKL